MSKMIPVKFKPGMHPEPDETNQNTRYIIDGNNIRFWQGGVEKIGGHIKEALSFVDQRGNVLSSITAYSGKPRAVMSYKDSSNRLWLIIGTHTKLYAKLGTTVYNITPLVTSVTATLSSDPLSMTDTETTLTITYTGHGLAVGDRIKLTGATDGAGITAATDINKEHVVSVVVNANTFKVELASAATSTDASFGGTPAIYKEIAAGGADAVNPSGPGVGIPGLGIPGSVQTDTSLFVQPRVWWFDLWGDNLVCGPGNAGKCYAWDGNIVAAPAVITNAPNADWAWVEDVKLVTLLGNRVKNSDVGDYTDWTTGAGSDAYEDDKEDARKLISRVSAGSTNLVFADENKVFSLRWVGGTVKWEWRQVSSTLGLCGPYSAININGIAYVFAKDDIYWWNGVSFDPLPNNTLKKHIFESINIDQRYKFFVWYNQRYQELCGHYTSDAATENDRSWCFNVKERHWTKRTISRTAADFAGQVISYPVLASPDGYIYQHESGYDDDSAAMEAWAQVSYAAISNGDFYTDISGLSPDLIQTGGMTVELYGKHDATDDGVLLETLDMPEGTAELNCMHETAWRSWIFRSNTLGGFFRLGNIREMIARGGEA